MGKNTLHPALERYFEEYLPSVRGASENTIRSYKYTFRLLFQFLFEAYRILPQNVDFKFLTADVISAFLQWLEQTRKCEIATRNQRLAAIRSFSNYAAQYYFQPALTLGTAISVIPTKKAPKRTMAYFTKAEMTIILSLPKNGIVSC